MMKSKVFNDIKLQVDVSGTPIYNKEGNFIQVKFSDVYK